MLPIRDDAFERPLSYMEQASDDAGHRILEVT